MRQLSFVILVLTACSIAVSNYAYAQPTSAPEAVGAREPVNSDREEELSARVGSADKSSTNVRRIQELLIELGYDPGTVDGFLGQKTYAALRAWSKSSNVAVGEFNPHPRTVNKKANFDGTAVLPGGALGTTAVGESVISLSGKNAILTSGVLESITSEEVKVSYEGNTKHFIINESTKICVGNNLVQSWADLKDAKFVTVTSWSGDGHALRIRDGKLLFELNLFSGASLVDHDCWKE